MKNVTQYIEDKKNVKEQGLDKMNSSLTSLGTSRYSSN